MTHDDELWGPGLSRWRLRIAREDVMWLRYVLEASEGVGLISGGHDGHVTLIAPHDQRAEVERILHDLVQEMPLDVLARPPQPSEKRPSCRNLS